MYCYVLTKFRIQATCVFHHGDIVKNQYTRLLVMVDLQLLEHQRALTQTL